MELQQKIQYPLVSIICFCRNAVDTIGTCIDAILAMNYPNIEVVVQDGASTDGTLDILGRYGERIKLVSEPDAGPNDAMFKALRRIKGEFFAFSLADELLLPHAASWAVENFASDSELSAIYGDHYTTDAHGKMTGIVTPPQWNFDAYLCSEITPPLCASFFRRSSYEKIGFTEYTASDEFDFWLNIALQGRVRYCKPAAPLAKYAVHTGSISFTTEHQNARLASRRRAVEALCDNPSTPENIRRLKQKALDSLLVWHVDSLCCTGLWDEVLSQATRAFAAGPDRNQLAGLAHKILNHALDLHKQNEPAQAMKFVDLLVRCNIQSPELDDLRNQIIASPSATESGMPPDIQTVSPQISKPSKSSKACRSSDMNYRFLIINTDYEHFLNKFYSENPRLLNTSFAEQHAARMATFFGVSDFYSRNLRLHGHKALDLIFNCPPMQYAWAVENGLISPARFDPATMSAPPREWFEKILQAQIRMFEPDVIINLAMETVTSGFLKKLKPHIPLIVGQHAAPFTPAMQDLSAYDLLLSSIPHYVDKFRSMGKSAEYFRLAFESTVCEQIPPRDDRDVDVAFVGGFSAHHLGGAELFNMLAEKGVAMSLHGYDADSLSPQARRCFHGPLYGREMYELYTRAKIVVNRHIDIAGRFANNMRLYEATGSGAMLLTDHKDNLNELFAVGEEVAAYSSNEQCAELIAKYLADDSQRRRIARNGHQRTLETHTYYDRMAELAGIVSEYIGKPARPSTARVPAVHQEEDTSEQVLTVSTESAAADMQHLLNIARQSRHGNYLIDFAGLKIYCTDLLSFYMAAKDIFMHRIYDFHAETETPIVIDGGGHIGLFTLFARNKYPNAKVTVFEPDAESRALLKKNLAANNMTDVRIVEAGLYKEARKISFDCDHSDGSTIYSEKGRSSIDVVPLSSYLDSDIDMLKLNIEGAELDVINEIAPQLPRVRELVIEYHGFPETGQNLHKILTKLSAAGFRYLIHDFDHQTNPATKPPFNIDTETRFFLLIYARRILAPEPAAVESEEPGLEPVSRQFGLDRGTPVDRWYIERFLQDQASSIRGDVLEIGDNTYTQQYGSNVSRSDVLNVEPSASATLTGNLATGENIPQFAYDCIIMTQTIQMIYDLKSALKNAVAALKPGGTLLLTASGISQISRYDMDRWGEYWRFTDKSLHMLLEEILPGASLTVTPYGNLAAARAFLEGRAAEELEPAILDYCDPDYQLVLTARLTKTPVDAESSTIGTATSTLVPASENPTFADPLILLYHRVADDPVDSQLLTVSPENFDAHLAHLAAACNVLPLPDLIHRIRENKCPPSTVAITFDDGYADNFTNALPILEKHHLPATIFVTTSAIDSDREFWWDALERIFLTDRQLPETLTMTDSEGRLEWPLSTAQQRLECCDQLCSILRNKPVAKIEQIVDMLLTWAGIPLVARQTHLPLSHGQLTSLAAHPLIEIGSHTVSHSRLSALSEKEQFFEIRASKQQLEAFFNKPVRTISYPFGGPDDFTPQCARFAAAEGYEAAIANTQGHITEPLDLFAVPRHLVRNWHRDDFADWLHANNKSLLETRTLAARTQRLTKGRTISANVKK